MGALVFLASALLACSPAETESVPDSAVAESIADTGAPASVVGPGLPARSAAPPAAPQGGQGLDQSELFIILEPVGNGETPADLLVLEPEGGRAGVEAGTYRAVRENTRAWYDSSPPGDITTGNPETGPLPKQYALVTPSAGKYVVDAIGRRDGAFSLVVRVILPSGERREAALRGARIRAGEVQRFSFVYAREGGAALAITMMTRN